MKCRKCRATMIRKRTTDHRYYYDCPVCHTAVGRVVVREHTVMSDGEVKENGSGSSSASGDTAG